MNRRHSVAPKRLGRLEQRMVHLLERRVNGQDHERNESRHQAKEHRTWRVEHGNGLSYDADPLQQLVDQSCIACNRKIVAYVRTRNEVQNGSTTRKRSNARHRVARTIATASG